MTCPNCKTELLRVNEHYICPECGKEVPENEVMAGDWGASGATKAGLYGGADPDGIPADSDAALTANQSISLDEVESVAGPIGEEAVEAPVAPVEQPVAEQVPEVQTTPEVDAGFYAPENAVVPEVVENIPVVENVPKVQEIPIKVPQAEIPVQSGEVKDLFVNTNEPVVDPGTVAETVDSSGDKKQTLFIVLIGILVALAMIGGGVWGYMTLSSSINNTPDSSSEIVDSWLELQVTDGDFKIDFPGQPLKTQETWTVFGAATSVVDYVYEADSVSYSANYAILDSTVAKTITDDAATNLPTLVNELAESLDLTVTDTTVGLFNDADAVDFVFSDAIGTHQGKIIVSGNTYIVISAVGDATDYDKFINSFNFLYFAE